METPFLEKNEIETLHLCKIILDKFIPCIFLGEEKIINHLAGDFFYQNRLKNSTYFLLHISNYIYFKVKIHKKIWKRFFF